jgi:hypothetical protein
MIKYWTGMPEQMQDISIPPPNVESSPLSASTNGGSGSFVMVTTHSLLTINLSFYVLRDMKSVVYSNKSKLQEYTSLVIQGMSTVRQDKLARLEERFPSLLKNLLQIGAGLVQPRELRDFFIDILEKFVDIIRSIPLTGEELRLFCDVLSKSFQDTTIKPNLKNKFAITWSAFMAVVRDVSVTLVYALQV